MEQFKDAKVVLVPTSRTSDLYIRNTVPYYLYKGKSEQRGRGGSLNIPQQLLITSEDEIKDGDWYLNQDNKLFKSNGILNQEAFIHCKKVIASYPPLEIETYYEIEGNQKIKQPQPTQQFIEQYIESYNKGEVITDVLVEYIGNLKVNSYHENGDPNKSDSHYIFYPKINPDNTITIKPIKDSWNREEVSKLLELAWATASAYGENTNSADCKDWINHNL